LSKCVFGSGSPSDPNRRNQMHRNNGDGTFTEVGESIGVDTTTQSWSSAVGDFDNDGDMDLVIADQHVNEIGTRFMVNNGDGTFDDITTGSIFENLDGAIDIVTFDFNNDGYLDIYSEFNTRLLLNNGDMTFTANASQITGGGAVGDLNNDGFLDVYKNGEVNFNDGNSNNWLKLNLVGDESNINGIGAVIRIEGDFGTQMRNVRSGEGFNNMHSLNPHFGLGTATVIDVLTVQWPSGIIDTFNDVTVNQTLLVNEGDNVLTVDENELLSLSVFPNPAKDNISIETPNNVTVQSVSIINVAGKRISTSISNNNIDVSTLSSGIYFLEIEVADDQRVIRKFIKN